MINFKTISAIALTAAVVAIAPIGNAEAALITGVTVSTDMKSFGGYDIQNIVNGSGLDSLSLTATHADVTPTNSWASSFETPTGTIDFNLNGQHSLQGFSIWNNADNTFGIQGVTISTSIDGSTCTALSGAPTQFAQGANGAEAAQQFAFAPTQANYVRFNVLSNYGAFATTLSEVQFDGTSATAPTAVPTPALLSGLIGLGVAALRKRKAEAASKA